MDTERALSSLRRDLTFGRWILRSLLLLAGVGFGLAIGGWPWARAVAAGALAAYVGLLVWSMRGGRLTADAALLIAEGRHEEAEERVGEAARLFGVLKPIKLATLHQVATLRQAQGRWREAQHALSALLRFGPRTSTVELMLAEASLAAGDLPTARRTLWQLRSETLSPSDAARLLAAQLDFQAKTAAWEPMLWRLPAKLEVLGLLDPQRQLVGTAHLALAAKQTDQAALASDLTRRGHLLGDLRGQLDAHPELSTIDGIPSEAASRPDDEGAKAAGDG